MSDTSPQSLVPAAQYLRMSKDHQRYSIRNQARAISAYAGQHGLNIVKTYTDPGESGLTLRERPGLQALLADVIKPSCPFERILVLDVSRWGRFQNLDQSGHYEFICFEAGVPVIYCAELFDIRLRGEERRALNEAASARGTSPANWVRALAIVHLGRKPQWNTAELSELRDVFKELRRIGNNVNQIARALNVAQATGQYPPHQHRAVEEAAELIRYEMRRVVAVMTGNFDYWGLPDAERPTAAPGAVERHDAAAEAAEAKRRRRPKRRPARFEGDATSD